MTLNRKKILSETNGSTMVESAIILPFVILAAITLVYLFINIYSQLCLQANMHIALRAEAGERNGLTTVSIQDAYERDEIRSYAENESFEFDTGRLFITQYIEGSKIKRYRGGGLTARMQFERKFNGRYYLLDEALIVRGMDVIF